VRTVTLDGIHRRDDVLASPAAVKVMHVHVQGRPFDVQGITPRLQVVQDDVQVSTSSVLALPLDVQEGHAARTGCTLDVQGGRAAAIARTVGVLARTDDVEEDAFVASVRGGMIDVLIARLDMIDDGASTQYAGRQRAGRNTPRTIARNNTHNTPPAP